VKGVQNRFRLGCIKEPDGGFRKPLRNMPSDQERLEVIENYLEEYSTSRVVCPLEPAVCTPVGLVSSQKE